MRMDKTYIAKENIGDGIIPVIQKGDECIIVEKIEEGTVYVGQLQQEGIFYLLRNQYEDEVIVSKEELQTKFE